MGRGFELHSERLIVRMLARRDVTELVRYRNHPDVARFQDWELPFTRDLAHRLLDEIEPFAGPAAGEWVQLALEHRASRCLVGDVATWLDAEQRQAMIGYTLAPEWQGQGYATEGVAAVVDWLFGCGPGQPAVHRIAATLDPRNGPSARVLEALGFEYEGTARSAAFVRGVWADDARFGLLGPDWESWKARPTGPPTVVELAEIGDGDIRPLLEIDLAFSQRKLVSSMGASFGDALIPEVIDSEPVRPWFRSIRADGQLVGFVMVAEPHHTTPHPYLWRLLVDRRHQRRGIGRRAVQAVAGEWRARGATHLLVGFVPDLPGNPRRFYEGLGFVLTGKVDGGEVEAILDLS